MELENLKSIFGYLSKPRILDVGTGVGNFIERIIKVYDNYLDIIYLGDGSYDM